MLVIDMLNEKKEGTEKARTKPQDFRSLSYVSTSNFYLFGCSSNFIFRGGVFMKFTGSKARMIAREYIDNTTIQNKGINNITSIETNMAEVIVRFHDETVVANIIDFDFEKIFNEIIN